MPKRQELSENFIAVYDTKEISAVVSVTYPSSNYLPVKRITARIDNNSTSTLHYGIAHGLGIAKISGKKPNSDSRTIETIGVFGKLLQLSDAPCEEIADFISEYGNILPISKSEYSEDMYRTSLKTLKSTFEIMEQIYCAKPNYEKMYLTVLQHFLSNSSTRIGTNKIAHEFFYNFSCDIFEEPNTSYDHYAYNGNFESFENGLQAFMQIEEDRVSPEEMKYYYENYATFVNIAKIVFNHYYHADKSAFCKSEDGQKALLHVGKWIVETEIKANTENARFLVSRNLMKMFLTADSLLCLAYLSLSIYSPRTEEYKKCEHRDCGCVVLVNKYNCYGKPSTVRCFCSNKHQNSQIQFESKLRAKERYPSQ